MRRISEGRAGTSVDAASLATVARMPIKLAAKKCLRLSTKRLPNGQLASMTSTSDGGSLSGTHLSFNVPHQSRGISQPSQIDSRFATGDGDLLRQPIEP